MLFNFNEFLYRSRGPSVFFTIDGERKDKLLTYEETLRCQKDCQLNGLAPDHLLILIANLLIL